MALNRSPQNPITQDDIDTYERDGAVVLRGVCNQDWIDRLMPLALRIAALFGRKPTTPWSDKEIAAWRKIKPQDIELDAIEAYYAGERSKRDGGVHRRDLGTFLNNYAGELDRATLAGFAGKAAPAKSKAQCIAEAATMFMRLTPESEAEWPRRKDGTHKTPDEVGAEMFAAQKGGAQ